MAKKYYFIGLAGIGMSGLARILMEQGNTIFGSDPVSNAETDKLVSAGATFYMDISAKNITSDTDTVVVTAAIPEDNVELLEAQRLGLKVMSRSQLLNEIITAKKAIAVTGTHGKTTTSSMLAEALIYAGLDPLVTVGAEVLAIGSNGKDGKGEYSVAEVCEYKDAFLDVHPFAAIITNIDADHLDFFKDIDDIKSAFVKFVTQIDPRGFLVYCADDANASEVAITAKCRRISYGTKTGPDYQATEVTTDEAGTRYHLRLKDGSAHDIHLCVPGHHNVLNSLAVIAAADQIGADLSKIFEALANFRGAERRFQYLGKYNDAVVIDDYGHHPTEIRATLEAARERYPKRNIIAVFQPHQHSRTKLLLDDFANAFSDADKVVVPEIYTVRDSAEDIASVSSADLVKLINDKTPGKAIFFKSFPETVEYLGNQTHDNDLIITIGAGPVNEVGEMLLKK